MPQWAEPRLNEETEMNVHLVDGTNELYRAHYGVPPSSTRDGQPISAVRGLVATLLALLREDGVTHIACAFDHVVESFRFDSESFLTNKVEPSQKCYRCSVLDWVDQLGMENNIGHGLHGKMHVKL